MDLDSMQRILEQSLAENKPIWEIVLEEDVANRMVTREASMEKMRRTWRAMVDSADAYSGERRSLSGLVGGDGERMRLYYATHESIGGSFTAEVPRSIPMYSIVLLSGRHTRPLLSGR